MTISHHLIPRWCGGTDEDIVELSSQSDHTRLEYAFDNFIKYGQFETTLWLNKKKKKNNQRQWARNHCRTKAFGGIIFHIGGFSIRQYLQIRVYTTGSVVGISHQIVQKSRYHKRKCRKKVVSTYSSF